MRAEVVLFKLAADAVHERVGRHLDALATVERGKGLGGVPPRIRKLLAR